MKRILIDTDPGYDDAFAIIYACLTEKFEISAITTVMGNSTVENSTRNARFTLNLIERLEIPIYTGAKAPLVREFIPAVVHGPSGLGEFGSDVDPKLTNDAVERIIEFVRDSESSSTIVAIAPLTNIARAIQEAPDVMANVEELVILGGTLDAPGNKGPISEFNFFNDPEAAEIVLASPLKKIIIPLDVCYTAVMFPEEFREMPNGARSDFIRVVIDDYARNNEAEEGIYGAIMYDPLAVYYLLEPEAFKLAPYDVRIETKGALTRGMMVPERRPSKEKSYNAVIAERVDVDAFKRSFLRAISK